jgi:hypothetical protein
MSRRVKYRHFRSATLMMDRLLKELFRAVRRGLRGVHRERVEPLRWQPEWAAHPFGIVYSYPKYREFVPPTSRDTGGTKVGAAVKPRPPPVAQRFIISISAPRR